MRSAVGRRLASDVGDPVSLCEDGSDPLSLCSCFGLTCACEGVKDKSSLEASQGRKKLREQTGRAREWSGFA